MFFFFFFFIEMGFVYPYVRTVWGSIGIFTKRPWEDIPYLLGQWIKRQKYSLPRENSQLALAFFLSQIRLIHIDILYVYKIVNLEYFLLSLESFQKQESLPTTPSFPLFLCVCIYMHVFIYAPKVIPVVWKLENKQSSLLEI